MNARPTEATLHARFRETTWRADMFHGHAWSESSATSRSGKAARPFAVSVRQFSGAATNLARRAVLREWAYPGLSELLRRFYAGLMRAEDASPISRERALAVALVGDRIAAAVAAPRDD